MNLKNIATLSESEKILFSRHTAEMMMRDRLKYARTNHQTREFYGGNHGQPAQSRVIGHASFPITPISRAVPIATILVNTKITQLLSNPPVPVVSMKVDTEDDMKARTIATAIQKKLEAVLDDNFSFQVFHQWLLDACLNRVGWIQVSSDDRGIHIENLDFDDVLIYPRIKKLEDSPLICKIFHGVIGMYMNDSNYKNIKKLSPHGKGGETIESMIQQKNDNEKLYTPGNISVASLNTFKAFEWQVPVMLTQGLINKLGQDYPWIFKKKPGDVVMNVFTISQDILIRDTYIDTDTYNIFEYRLEPGPMYGESIYRRAIATNRSVDNIISQIEFYIATALKFRVVANRASDIGDIDNFNGSIIDWSGDIAPDVFPIRDIPQGLFEYLQSLIEMLHFIFGVSPSSMAKQGSGAKSKGQAMEAARMTDFFNNAPAIKRFEISLTKMTRCILDILANSIKEETFSYEHMDMNTGRMKGQKVRLIGEKYQNQMSDLFVDKWGSKVQQDQSQVVIKHDYPVNIEIAQGLNYSSDSIRTQLVDLVKLGVLPQELLSDIFAYGKLLEWIEMAKKREAQRMQDEHAAEIAKTQNQQSGKMQASSQKDQAKMKLQELKGKQQLAQKTQPMLLEALLEKQAQEQQAQGPVSAGQPQAAPSANNSGGVSLSSPASPQDGGATSGMAPGEEAQR